MASLDDVRRIVGALPGVEERPLSQSGGVAWRTKAGLVVWERGPTGRDLEQLAELGRSWPPGMVVALRTDDVPTALALVEDDPDVFFTIPHLDGSPIVLARLGRVTVSRLRELLTDAWLVRAPQRVAAAWLAEHAPER